MLSPDGELLAATRLVGDELSVWETRTGRRSFDLKSPTPLTSARSFRPTDACWPSDAPAA